MDNRAQASIETILLIAAAVLIATVVGMFLKNLASQNIAPAVNREFHATASGLR